MFISYAQLINVNSSPKTPICKNLSVEIISFLLLELRCHWHQEKGEEKWSDKIQISVYQLNEDGTFFLWIDAWLKFIIFTLPNLFTSLHTSLTRLHFAIIEWHIGTIDHDMMVQHTIEQNLILNSRPFEKLVGDLWPSYPCSFPELRLVVEYIWNWNWSWSGNT